MVGQREHRNTEAKDMKTKGTMASGHGGQWQEAVGASSTGNTVAKGMETQGLYKGTRDISRRTQDTGDKNIWNRGRGEK